uniref:NADH dehydrogenase subunit 5 n=1 Tax=Ptychadena nuerensis TaxID=2039362 RepID=UPI00286C6483|nr:NADH dehydrogenase subunit 5 [Ptychadena nuerensis]WKT09036.1 NADH dehydrogenase subunit 5 [Ptychadena nuerensis]
MTLLRTLYLLRRGSPRFLHTAISGVKWAFFISLIPLLVYLSESYVGISFSASWFDVHLVFVGLVLKFDLFPTIFLPIALFITWKIMVYSTWYMFDDPNFKKFIVYLLIFLMTMTLLVTSGNTITLFLGWEGVGLLSFLLIGWYFSRHEAIAAAMQAILYNRAGDMGFLMALCWLISKTQSMTMDYLLAMSVESSTTLLLGFILAAASKSAQFGLHPWLAAAMEGPTPVSALLHSSTMVVAGIFLLIRIHPVLELDSKALSICLCLGAISTFYASLCALTQNDIKKIIAYSTASQLGLMMVSIGLNMPMLALFHICTHAFFKAMLFLCSGILIHNLDNEQDIRKMGGLQYHFPICNACLSVGSLALMGTPFLAGFYSKDAIVEAISSSTTNSAALILTLVAISFTAVYSLRLIFYAVLDVPRRKAPYIRHELYTPYREIYQLGLGSIFAGWMIFHFFVPNNLATHTMPLTSKLAALAITAMSFYVALGLARHYWTLPPNKSITPFQPFGPNLYYMWLNRILTDLILRTARKHSTHTLDYILLKFFMPELIRKSQLPAMKHVRMGQSGHVKLYLFAMLITLILAVLITLVL